jgi:hypothetical protein
MRAAPTKNLRGKSAKKTLTQPDRKLLANFLSTHSADMAATGCGVLFHGREGRGVFSEGQAPAIFF